MNVNTLINATLGEVEVGEQVEQRRVERVALALLALELLEESLLVSRARLQELEQRLPEVERLGGAFHRGAI